MASKVLFALLLSFPAITLHAQQREQGNTSWWATVLATEDRIYPNIVYNKAGGYEVKLDVITAGPDFAPRPTVIFFHGGGWVGGSKDSSTLGALPYLVHGMNVVNVEYRLASVALAPAAVEDSRCALRWVYQFSKQYGFDTSRLVVAGGSAGGHLALMTGMLDPNAGFDNIGCGWWPPRHQELKVAAIVNFYGITDVVDVLDGPNRQDWAVAWLGSLPNRVELAKRLSPLTYVRSSLPPILTIHGDLDVDVPYQQGVRLHEALDRAGVPNVFVTITGGKHGFWTREQNLKARQAVFDFLQEYGILSR
jgi:acetyl esterase/lipase